MNFAVFFFKANLLSMVTTWLVPDRCIAWVLYWCLGLQNAPHCINQLTRLQVETGKFSVVFNVILLYGSK